MASDKGHIEGIRHQAERVVRAYKALREAPKNSDFKSDDFPVGLFAELLGEIKRLDGWLEPIADTDEAADIAARCEAIGYQHYVTDKGWHLIVDHHPDSDRAPELVFIDEDDKELESWLADQERVSERVRKTRGVDTEKALRALKQAERLLEVCMTSVEAIEANHSQEVAFTMGAELWDAIEDAKQALGEAENAQ